MSGDNRPVEERLADLEQTVEEHVERDLPSPLELAALRRLLHEGALEVLEDEDGGPTAEDKATDLNPMEKCEIVLERLSGVEQAAVDLRDRIHLQTLLSQDEPTKRARKMEVLEHLIEKAEKERNGKTLVRTDTVEALTDVSGRQARRYMDEMAEEVPGVQTKTGEDVGDGKQLRMDLETYQSHAPAADTCLPRSTV